MEESLLICDSLDHHITHDVVIVMKKVLVILLLFIFFVQGAVVALGGGLVLSRDGSGMTGMTQAVSSPADHPDADHLKVSSSIEEMSDYVAWEPALKQPRDRASNPPTIASVLSSIDLPQALPPPRG